MKRALRLLAVVTGLALALVGTMAVAAWLSSGSGGGTVTATTVLQAHAPSATAGTGQVSLSWTASTLANGSPVGGYQVFRHDGATTTPVCAVTAPTVACTDPGPVATAVTYGVVATVGTHWTGPESTRTSFTYDDVKPATTASISPAPNAALWNNTSVTVTLQATDSGNPASGVDHVTYTVDAGSPVTVVGASTSFAVSSAGTHTVTYGAVDKAGNAEVTHSTTVKIDPNAPVTTVTPSPTANGAGWNNTNVSLAFSATDVASSGVKSVTVDGVTTSGSTASKTVSAEGTTTVSYFATDVADNIEGTKSITLHIDKTAPTATISPEGTPTGGYYTSNQVTITAADATSGVALTEYSLDGGSSYHTYTGAITLPEGTNTVRARVTDKAGNVLTTTDATIKVDSVIPTVTLSQTGSGQPTISGTDATSGIGSVSWRDGGSGGYTQVSGSSTTLNLSNGSHTIWYFATDNAGNASTPTSRTITVNIDTTAPAFTNVNPADSASFVGNGTNSWGTAGCNGGRICATVTDAGTGVSTVTYQLTTGSLCWNGSSFGSGTCSANTMTLNTGTAANGTWQGGLIDANLIQTGATRTYTLVITATDGASNSKTSTTTFTAK